MVFDRLQKQQLADKKHKGEEKPFKKCKECLYILDNCTICNNAEMFFDRENIIHTDINETFVEKGIFTTIKDNRVTTQKRDGCNF